MNRYEDWLNQAEKDFESANDSKNSGHFEWTCFQAQQSAEKALKSLLLYLNIDSWGNGLVHLLKNLEITLNQFQESNSEEKQDNIKNESELKDTDIKDQINDEIEQSKITPFNQETFMKFLELCQELDRHYIQPRYPNGFPDGYPAEYYNEKIAKECIHYARNIINFVKEKIAEISSSG